MAVEIDANKDQEASVPVNDSGTSNSGRHPLVLSMSATEEASVLVCTTNSGHHPLVAATVSTVSKQTNYEVFLKCMAIIQ